jgi:hypothetical protein
MKCLRIYADPNGESHFADLEIPLSPVQLFADQPPLRISAHYRASHVQFVTVPAEMRESGWHCPRERVLAIWLTGNQEFETSDGEIRRLGQEAPCWPRIPKERGITRGIRRESSRSF